MFVDFGSTSQTFDPHKPSYIENYFGAFHVLLGGEGDVGFDSKLVWEHFGEPDDWDPIYALIPTTAGSAKEWRTVTARDMFSFISSV